MIRTTKHTADNIRPPVGCRSSMHGLAVWAGMVLAWFASPVFAQLDESSAEHSNFFESRIRPILIEACLDCHSAETEASGELLLDSRDGWAAGGSSGAAIVPGEPDASLLMKAMGYNDPHLQMPPDGRLPESVLADFRQWIEQGAFDPREGQTVKPNASQALSVADAQQHWAYRPIAAAVGLTAEGVTDGSEETHEQLAAPELAAAIDAFVDAGLVEAGLEANPTAAPQAIVRRLYFDLTGLPPTPAEMQAFLQDPEPETAYSRLVDRLLMSPRYGETMARRWMDVVRYADSITLRGFVLPQAWRYRDYLIRAYNEDRPFATMIEEQVAGDLLSADDDDQRQQQLIATTFWTLGNTNLEQQDKTQLEMDFIDEQLDVLGHALLGQTIGCARCHDHKFDPIPTRDYYALAGILRSTAGMDHENVSKWIERPLPLSAEREQFFDELSSRRQALVEEIKELKQAAGPGAKPDKHIRIDSLPGIVVDNKQAKLVGQWTLSTSNPPIIGDDYAHDGNTGKGEKSATFEPQALPPGEYLVRMSYTAGDNRARRVRVRVSSAAGETEVSINQRKPAPEDGTWVMLGKFPFEKDGQAFVIVSNADTDGHVIVDAVQFLPTNGSVVQQDPESADDAAIEAQRKLLAERERELKQIETQLAERPKFMTIVERNEPVDIPIHIRGDVHNLGQTVPRGFLTALQHAPSSLDRNESPGRLEFARWLSHPENPLTARVYTNRVWAWLMGQGIVSTLDNFGTTGAEPSYPELLDWLATELVRSNWSTKSLVRAIVHSRAYRRSSDSDVLGSETCAACETDPQNRWLWRGHKRRVSVEALRDAMLLVSGELDLSMGGSLIPAGVSNDYNFASQQPRRSVYQPVFRNSLPQLFESFDFANPSAPVGQRPRSTVATQALELMNHPWVAARAEHAAERFAALMPDASAETLMDTLCGHCFGRSATPAELDLAVATFGSIPVNQIERDELATLIHALFASLDFRYVD